MEIVEYILKSVQSGNTALAVALIAGAALYGVWKLALWFMGFLTTLFKNTNEELRNIKEMFFNLTKEVEKLNIVLEKTVELSSQRFEHVEQRVSRLEDHVDDIRNKN